MRLCTIPGCGRKHKGHGLCNMHLIRQRNTGTTDSFVRSQEERFWDKVDQRGPDECWEWTGALTSTGYGALRPAGQRCGPVVKAHRYSAELRPKVAGSGRYYSGAVFPPTGRSFTASLIRASVKTATAQLERTEPCPPEP